MSTTDSLRLSLPLALRYMMKPLGIWFQPSFSSDVSYHVRALVSMPEYFFDFGLCGHHCVQLREVAVQNVTHRCVLHPFESFFGVHLSIPRSGDETVTLQSPTGHENQNPEGRVTEAEALS